MISNGKLLDVYTYSPYQYQATFMDSSDKNTQVDTGFLARFAQERGFISRSAVGNRAYTLFEEDPPCLGKGIIKDTTTTILNMVSDLTLAHYLNVNRI